MAADEALAIMEAEVGKAIDTACFEALRSVVADGPALH
jgi:hypothetical protein